MAEAGYGDDDDMSVSDIKAALLDSLFGTERGLAARSEVRAEINELITQLEAKNPSPSPTEVGARPGGGGVAVFPAVSDVFGGGTRAGWQPRLLPWEPALA
jgi:hypothetical protein